MPSDGSAGDAFAELLALPGVCEDLELRSRFGFMAFHGGSLEEVTDVVAAAAAERAGASYYAVRQPPDLQWHLPSIQIQPRSSPRLRAFLDHVSVAVAVHGYGREGYWTSLLLGGSNRRLAAHLAARLEPALPGYEAIHDLERIPAGLRGMHARNPVNLPSEGGVQIELPPRVRGRSPLSPPLGPDGLSPPTSALIDALAASALAWPDTGVDAPPCSAS
ncbi:MAG: hypothetical protein JWN46_2868 [Acidimicrobiales bacterium]|nr:hypothetical protein [Acidimicrobiales bacterium]